jgi:lipoprotein-anchoring transpeptidase ErfK/SrfK
MHQYSTYRYVVFAALFAAALIALGCQPPPAANSPAPASSPAASANANANSGTSNTASSEASANAMPVTMPLLDSMFADESFAADAKQKLQLTDEQIQKLSDAAKNAVLKLGTDPSDDDARSTQASIKSTRAELEKILGKEKADEFLNFVRSRWAGEGEQLAALEPNSVPSDTRVVVNAPAYRMDLFKDGKLVKTYKVGIGYPEFPLPTGLRRAKEIIFNPTWTPPDEPWVKGKFAPGKKVEAGSKLNPLGHIKIPIGLPSLIHGGKDPSRLGTFASHGCVGLTNAMIQDFAKEISAMAGDPMTLDEIKAREKSKTETEEVKLTNSVPVELRYETIVAEDGKITIYRDVYEKGTNTEENLKKVLQTFGVSFDSLAEADRAKLTEALDQMAVDATGQAVPDEGNANTKPSKSSKVTRNVKGKKEVVVELAALKGKGYPSPVALMSK